MKIRFAFWFIIFIKELASANDCLGYYDKFNNKNLKQQCGLATCCGKCTSRYCCNDLTFELNQSTCTNNIDPNKIMYAIYMTLITTGGVILIILTFCSIVYIKISISKWLKKRRQGNVLNLNEYFSVDGNIVKPPSYKDCIKAIENEQQPPPYKTIVDSNNNNVQVV